MRSEISDKLDSLTVSIQETKDEGKLLKLTNKTLSKRSTEDRVEMYFFEGVVPSRCSPAFQSIIIVGVSECKLM